MKKILFCLAVCVLGLIGCEEDTDPAFGYNYIYINGTASDITVTVFVPSLNPDKGNTQVYLEFIVPANKEYTENGYTHSAISDRWAFWQNLMPGTYAVISNGEKQVTNNLDDAVGIFNLDNYTPILENYDDNNWIFVFTDDFFADGEPVDVSLLN